MTQLRFAKTHDLARLHDELLEAQAIPSDAVVEGDGLNLSISGDGVEEAKVAAVLGAHDAAAAAAAAKQERANEAAIQTRLEDAIAKLEQAGAGWADLTPAQKDAATRLAVRAVAKVARLQLQRLDAVE